MNTFGVLARRDNHRVEPGRVDVDPMTVLRDLDLASELGVEELEAVEDPDI